MKVRVYVGNQYQHISSFVVPSLVPFLPCISFSLFPLAAHVATFSPHFTCAQRGKKFEIYYYVA